jgi:predicted RNase H-like HicB family nuclease
MSKELDDALKRMSEAAEVVLHELLEEIENDK